MELLCHLCEIIDLAGRIAGRISMKRVMHLLAACVYEKDVTNLTDTAEKTGQGGSPRPASSIFLGDSIMK